MPNFKELKKLKKIKINKELFLNVLFVLFSASIVERVVTAFLKIHTCYDWNTSEFLINYQGGFVRRGLLGEILFFFTRTFNMNAAQAELVIKIISLIFLAAVCVFFIMAFLKKGYSLYILPLCFFLGGVALASEWIRKDYLLFCFFIPIFYFYEKNNLPMPIKIIIANILTIPIILTHEVFAFFTFPILFLLFFNHYKNRGFPRSVIISFLCLLPGTLAFLSTLLWNGNQEIAQNIWNSWAEKLSLDAEKMGHAVNAISWSAYDAFKKHFTTNFLTIARDVPIPSLLGWMITFPIIYYISTNALLVFRKNEKIFTQRDKSILSYILVFQLLCLSPVFTILSMDYVRVIFYWIASSFAIFLLIPVEKITELFPPVFVRFVRRVNNLFDKYIPPTKKLVVLFMLFLGICPVSFRILGIIKLTMVFNIIHLLFLPFIDLFDIQRSIEILRGTSTL